MRERARFAPYLPALGQEQATASGYADTVTELQARII